MKVLLSTPFDFTCPGGVNAHVHHLDRELQRLGHTTRILSPGATDGRIDDDGHLCRIGTAVSIPANGSTARITLSPFLTERVRTFLEREQFDVIHLNDPLTSTLHLTVLANSNSVNVGTFHASNSSYFGYNLLYKFGRPFFGSYFGRLHYRVAVSPVARDFIAHYFPASYHLVPNGIDYDAFGPGAAPDPGIASPQPTVLFVGRFDESRKGFRYLLEAMPRVQEVIPDCRLVVVGPGDQEYYQRLIRRLQLRNITFTGPVPKEALPAMYAACDVFCAPSTGRESFGIVLLEAMASGKPVVATNINGYRLVARANREALLVDPQCPAQLSQALVDVLQNSELARKLGAAGRQRAESFSWPTIARRIVECYELAQQRVHQRRPSLATSKPVFRDTHRPQDRIGDMNAQRPGR